MECTKCKSKIPDGAIFCPWCGKKVTTKKRSDGIPLVEYLRVCSADSFSEQIKLLSKMPPADIKDHLFNDKVAIPVYVAKTTIRYTRVFSDGVCKPGQDTLCLTKDDVVDIARDRKFYGYPVKNFTVDTVEKILTKSDIPLIGKTVFFTKAECEALVEEILQGLEPYCE